MFNQAVQLSLKSDNENKLKYTIGNLQDLKDKLTYVSLPDNWLVWHNGNVNMRFIRPNLLDNTISVDISGAKFIFICLRLVPWTGNIYFTQLN